MGLWFWVSLWGVTPFDCAQKRRSGFYGLKEVQKGLVQRIIIWKRHIFFRNWSSRIAKPLPLGKGPPAGRGIGRRVCRQRISRDGADYGMCRTESVVKQT